MADASARNDATPPSPSILKAREDFLAKAQANLDEYRRQNPDQAHEVDKVTLSSNWWHPASDLGVVLQESVPKETNAKLAEAARKFIASDFARTALDEFMAEARALLAGHDDALRMVESTFGEYPSRWDALREHALKVKAEGGSFMQGAACGLARVEVAVADEEKKGDEGDK